MHFVLHKLLTFHNVAFTANAEQFTADTLPRYAYENAIDKLLAQQNNLELELYRMSEQSDEASKAFLRSLTESQTRNYPLGLRWSPLFESRICPASSAFFILIDENWSNKLDAFRYLGDAMRFIALVRTVLQGNITLNEANRMTIDQGLSKIIEVVEQKAVLLDRGRAVLAQDHFN